ncbi:MAG TPA: hypothetical protein VFP85_10135 [Vicinamibacterales bacterium]|nr:hypothetical protein [Vicinamibacterales bacterium]
MTQKTFVRDLAIAAVCALTLAACEAGLNQPTSPSAVIGSGGAASNPDGSTLKVAPSVATFPLNDATGVGTSPTLVGVPGAPKNGVTASTFAYRFQVSTSDSFDTIFASGAASIDSQGVARFTIGDTPLATGTRYFWRLRAELLDAFGPWSNVNFFTTTGTVTPAARPDQAGERRTPNPPPGQQLALPDMRGELNKFANASNSCPRNLQYVRNPWLDSVIDHFRTFDTRWGYNAKPTRTANDNRGVPVEVAGDEGAYNYTALADEGNTGVHLVDMLVGHCGSSPQIGWRVFTGEEPGRWTGAGRF